MIQLLLWSSAILLANLPGLTNGCTIVNVCEGVTSTLSCPSGQIVHIVSAYYGIMDNTVCSKVTLPSPCTVDVRGYVQKFCEGKSSCSFKADATYGDPCVGYGKYTSICMSCVNATSVTGNCYTANTDVGGTTIQSMPVASIQSCQLQCQRHDSCQIFVYSPSISTCWLKYGSTALVSATDRTTGPKFCPGPCYETTSNVPTSVAMSISSVASPSVCQIECQRRGECQSFVYDQASQVCYINYQSGGTKVIIANAVIGPKSCAYNTFIGSCYWENVDFNVALVRTITNVYNAYDCQSTCQAFSDCYYFVYDKTVYYCYHKVNAYSAAYNTKFTSGPKVCPDNAHALDYGVNYPGYDLTMLSGIKTVVECQTSCLNYAGCSYFTYTYNGNYCYLKNGWPRVGDGNYISGPRSDYIYPDTCLLDNTVMGAYDIRDFDIGYVYECQYWCQLEPACNYYTILKKGTAANNGVAHCWLKFAYGNTNYDPSYLVGSKNCNQMQYLCFYDFIDTGCNSVVNSFTTTSAHHCQSSCSTNPACNYFSFDKVSKWCYLKDVEGCNITNANRISGPKTCGYMNDACSQDFTVSQGTTLSMSPNIQTSFHCGYICKKNSACVGYNYHKWLMQCTLLSAVTTTSSDPYYMTGNPKDCGGFVDGCLWDNTNTDGSDTYSIIPNIPDMFTCQYKCSIDSKCLYFTHNKLNQFCFLKNGAKVLTEDPLAISGPNSCTTLLKGRCYQDFYYQPGTALIQFARVNYVQYCQMYCQSTLNCIAFNYNKVTWNCELLSRTSGAANLNPAYITGPKLCEPLTGIGSSYRSVRLITPVTFSTNLRIVSAHSALECAALCNADFITKSSCTAITWTETSCQLYVIGPFEYELTAVHLNSSSKSLVRKKLFTTT